MLEELKESLKTNIVEITFQKINGEERSIKGTLSSKYILEPENIKEFRQRTQKDMVTCFWDITVGGWKSFRNDSLISYKIIEKC